MTLHYGSLAKRREWRVEKGGEKREEMEEGRAERGERTGVLLGRESIKMTMVAIRKISEEQSRVVGVNDV